MDIAVSMQCLWCVQINGGHHTNKFCLSLSLSWSGALRFLTWQSHLTTTGQFQSAGDKVHYVDMYRVRPSEGSIRPGWQPSCWLKPFWCINWFHPLPIFKCFSLHLIKTHAGPGFNLSCSDAGSPLGPTEQSGRGHDIKPKCGRPLLAPLTGSLGFKFQSGDRQPRLRFS